MNLDNLRVYVGIKEGTVGHKAIVDYYNSMCKPLARGYTLQYKDAWCAAFMSMIGRKHGIIDVYEVGAEELYKKCLNKYGKGTGQVGELVFYDWNGDGHIQHVGLILSRYGDIIEVIEGNYKDSVGIRKIDVKDKNIKAFTKTLYKGEIKMEYDKNGWYKDDKGWKNINVKKDGFNTLNSSKGQKTFLFINGYCVQGVFIDDFGVVYNLKEM